MKILAHVDEARRKVDEARKASGGESDLAALADAIEHLADAIVGLRHAHREPNDK